MSATRISIFLLTAALLWTPAGSLPTFAQNQPSQDALQNAQQLVGLMSPNIIEQISVQMTNLSWPAFEGELRAKYPTISAEAMNAVRTELHNLDKAFVTEIVQKEAPQIYARFFSASELAQLIAFYRTPTGAKSLQVMPNISAQFNVLSIARLPSLTERMYALTNAILRVYGYVK